MIDAEKGKILLNASGFNICNRTTPGELATALSTLICRSYRPTPKNIHYLCWIDIEPREYVYAEISFSGNVLESMRIFPQHESSEADAPQPNAMDIKKSGELARKWYEKYFDKDELLFSWGSVKFCEGSDPVYGPPCVLISYKREEKVLDGHWNHKDGKEYIKLCEHIEKIYQNEIKHGNTPVLISTPKYVDTSATAEIYVIMKNKLQSYDIDGVEEMFYTDYHFPSERFYCCKSCMHCISGPVDEDQKIWFKPSPDDLPFENVEAREDNVYIEDGAYGKYMCPTIKINREK